MTGENCSIVLYPISSLDNTHRKITDHRNESGNKSRNCQNNKINIILCKAVKQSTARNKEYEYCVTNGDVDIDLITAKRARKRVVSVAGRKIETLLPYDTAKSTAGYQRVVVAAPSLREAGLWSFTYHSKKNGHTLVVFQPEQRVLSALYQGLPKLVQMDTRRAMEALHISIE